MGLLITFLRGSYSSGLSLGSDLVASPAIAVVVGQISFRKSDQNYYLIQSMHGSLFLWFYYTIWVKLFHIFPKYNNKLTLNIVLTIVFYYVRFPGSHIIRRRTSEPVF